MEKFTIRSETKEANLRWFPRKSSRGGCWGCRKLCGIQTRAESRSGWRKFSCSITFIPFSIAIPTNHTRNFNFDGLKLTYSISDCIKFVGFHRKLEWKLFFPPSLNFCLLGGWLSTDTEHKLKSMFNSRLRRERKIFIFARWCWKISTQSALDSRRSFLTRAILSLRRWTPGWKQRGKFHARSISSVARLYNFHSQHRMT